MDTSHETKQLVKAMHIIMMQRPDINWTVFFQNSCLKIQQRVGALTNTATATEEFPVLHLQVKFLVQKSIQIPTFGFYKVKKMNNYRHPHLTRWLLARLFSLLTASCIMVTNYITNDSSFYVVISWPLSTGSCVSKISPFSSLLLSLILQPGIKIGMDDTTRDIDFKLFDLHLPHNDLVLHSA